MNIQDARNLILQSQQLGDNSLQGSLEIIKHLGYIQIDTSAAYCLHLIDNHAFNDGNKRVGIVAALIFLEIKNYEMNVTVEALEKFVIDLASGKLSKIEVTRFIRKNTRELLGK
jgi:death-on-curing family protein